MGGYEGSETIYIGRATYGSDLIVGKVLLKNSKRLRIATPDGKEEYLTTFEILVYDLVN